MSNIKALKKLRTAGRNMAKGRNLENHEECNLVLVIADEIQDEVDSRFMLLPVDVKGVPIRPGDQMTDGSQRIDGLGIAKWDVVSVNECAFFDMSNGLHIGKQCWHVEPRTLEDIMAEYAELASKQEVKDYLDVSNELRKIQREQFRDKPERELYKEVDGYEFYIELPYDEMRIMTDKAKVKHHSYAYMYKRPNGNTVYSCSSLCGYSREWAIEQIEKTIESELLGVDE